jgi:hypothetical protein
MGNKIPILWGLNNVEIMEELTRLEYKFGTIDEETREHEGYPGAGEYRQEIGLIASALRRVLELVTPEDKLELNGNMKIDPKIRKVVNGD